MQAYMCSVHIRTTFNKYRPVIQSFSLFPPLSAPLLVDYSLLLTVLGNPLFGDRGANVHLHSSLLGDRLPAPCSLPSPSPPNGSCSSCYMFFKDDITTSATLSDTARMDSFAAVLTTLSPLSMYKVYVANPKKITLICVMSRVTCVNG
jgi:hypothetical protein